MVAETAQKLATAGDVAAYLARHGYVHLHKHPRSPVQAVWQLVTTNKPMALCGDPERCCRWPEGD